MQKKYIGITPVRRYSQSAHIPVLRLYYPKSVEQIKSERIASYNAQIRRIYSFIGFLIPLSFLIGGKNDSGDNK